MDKIDFRKTLKTLYAPGAVFQQVDVPPLTYVMVDGAGDPNTSPAYGRAVEALYGVSYGLKFAVKAALGRDYVVPPLEGLWTADDPAAFVRRDKAAWRWTMMILAPDFAPRDLFDQAVQKSRAKQGDLPDSLRLETYVEGASLQILHTGPYDDEGPILQRMHDIEMPARGLTFNGPHHEIYLSDPRRTVAARLKTILRQPVRPL
ncbi:MAG: hypothetical protein EON88_31600 [Brevundimonas sp.]|nr:MAG: hypothetical protein EON88_31600 [Brevundimonas sp.]